MTPSPPPEIDLDALRNDAQPWPFRPGDPSLTAPQNPAHEERPLLDADNALTRTRSGAADLRLAGGLRSHTQERGLS